MVDTMKLQFLKKIFAESNVHGIGLIFRPRQHLLERLLWISLICTSLYFALTVCRKEWHRYQDNSVVLSLETNWRNWEYLAPGVTICTDYIDDTRANNFVETNWNLSENDSNFPIYKNFVEVIARTTYGNLQELRQFSKYTFLHGLNLLQIAREMREDLLPESGFNLVTTEMGVCFSSTYLYLLQNVTERTVETTLPNGDLCRSTLSQDSCSLTVYPPRTVEPEDTHTQTLFVHNKDDVLNPTKAIVYNFTAETTTSMELVINSIVPSNKLEQLSPAQRKCYFASELPLKYFNIYTTNLCLISCRIDAAVKYCGCIPFFYSINSTHAPACNVLGMACLSNKWYRSIFNTSQFDKTCNCLPLCSNFEYRRATVQEQTYFEFMSSVELVINCPKNRLKRGVVYSADNLLVAFGGAFGFALGCSIISIVEFVFFIVEICIEKVVDLLSTLQARKS
ncbi:sodium channel protein Nach-like [Bradysia coprophila]|uniref:sodium channel protein Nach-like n=1 Tax=Bradysia coprophila TaxID=38358 RepID=UPI00187DB6EC|nr:sodium channel protein Nach-like [Bradysia coprophila]